MKGEDEYRELCRIFGKPLGVPKMWLCDILHAAAFHEIKIDHVLLGKYYLTRFGWNWEEDDSKSLLDFTRETFGERAVQLVNALS